MKLSLMTILQIYSCMHMYIIYPMGYVCLSMHPPLSMHLSVCLCVCLVISVCIVSLMTWCPQYVAWNVARNRNAAKTCDWSGRPGGGYAGIQTNSYA